MVEAYDEREEELGDELMRALERFMLLQIIDERWREHLHDMDYLREGIHLRGFAQIDPLVAYKNEGFEMFTDADEQRSGRSSRATSSTSRSRSRARNGSAGRSGRWAAAAPAPTATRAAGATAEARRAIAAAAGEADELPEGIADAADLAAGEVLAQPIVGPAPVDEKEKIGRNDPCWCGSGKKYKKCHGA